VWRSNDGRAARGTRIVGIVCIRIKISRGGDINFDFVLASYGLHFCSPSFAARIVIEFCVKTARLWRRSTVLRAALCSTRCIIRIQRCAKYQSDSRSDRSCETSAVAAACRRAATSPSARIIQFFAASIDLGGGHFWTKSCGKAAAASSAERAICGSKATVAIVSIIGAKPDSRD
jgi:hypothetical protein